MTHKSKRSKFFGKSNKVYNLKTEFSSALHENQPRMKSNVAYFRTEPLQRGEGLDSYLEDYNNPIPKSNLSSKSGKWLYLTEAQWKIALSIIGFICILLGCLYQSGSFLSLYLVYPTTVEFNVANEAVLDFPAVTICNSNPVRYKLWCEEDASVCIRKPNETLEDIRNRHENQYDTLTKDRRIRLGHQFKDFLLYAEYENESVNEEFTWYYDYEFTNCYTFNSVWGNQTAKLKTAVLFNPVTGKSSELIMCVNIDVDNYSNMTGTVVGRVKMTIHANDIVPNPTYDAASLEAGEFYSYGIQKVTTELLESPYQTKCRNYEKEKEVRTGAKMSQKMPDWKAIYKNQFLYLILADVPGVARAEDKNCLLECFKTETENMCGCTYRRLSLMYDAIPCEYQSQHHCLDVVEDHVFNLCNPQCPMPCKKIEFQFVATDSEPLRNESSLYEKIQINKFFQSKKDMNKNMACFRIHYGSTETRTLSYRPKYEFIELFSLLGGYSGLWLGFSLLNCYEFVLSKLVLFILNKKASATKKRLKRIRKRKYYNS